MSNATKLRLIVWEACDRNCPGCCNKDFDIANLPTPNTFAGYDTIIFTGGEPMLDPDRLRSIMLRVRLLADPGTKFILYTANYNIESHIVVLPFVNGMTITLHEQEDVRDFMRLYGWLRIMNKKIGKDFIGNKSMRLNVFEGIEHPDVSDIFSVKSGIRWIKDCPLPEGEVLMRLR